MQPLNTLISSEEMKNANENIYELIENFLEGKLSEKEAEKVSARIKIDPDFATEVEWMMSVLKIKQFKKAVAVVGDFKQIHRRHHKVVVYKRLAAAAALALLLGFCLWLYFKNGNQFDASSPIDIVKKDSIENTTPQEETAPAASDTLLTPAKNRMEKPEPTHKIPTVKNKTANAVAWNDFVQYDEGLQTLSEETESEDLSKALALMDTGKKKDALPFLEKYLASLRPDDEDFDMRIEAAKIYLKAFNDFDKASFHLRIVIDGDAVANYKLEAKFYTAMIAIAKGNLSQAKTVLREIQSSQNPHWTAEAEKVLNQLPK
jgi:tetratricopeptide (TPR) repeat protein